MPRTHVLIPARAGSVGLPGKNLRPLVEQPLISYSLTYAQSLRPTGTILVSTDDPKIADVAQAFGASIPELRPANLSTSDTPMTDVIRYACDLLDAGSSDHIVLLDPTSPLRQVNLGADAMQMLTESSADGVIAVSRPSFNPFWVGVSLEASGQMKRLNLLSTAVSRRQDAPEYFRINGAFYIWTCNFARQMTPNWPDEGTHLGIETPELWSHSIDTIDDFRLVEALLISRTVTLPWMESSLAGE